ncbi:hypothetical protein P171DRAFT_441446 [Karstenula rhodostoma CBS 690.94]|uniref:Spartan-like zinc binding domain-containing protein n=1 Tax=Karstenula rhodostoma CBS 690.94 TaxID=1392251 RepID=A0A9P4PNX4_9PLEO|nr:hypothetical protein P171DRAFT_441446 [Karstenula rhodostoma CBS 690.94]
MVEAGTGKGSTSSVAAKLRRRGRIAAPSPTPRLLQSDATTTCIGLRPLSPVARHSLVPIRNHPTSIPETPPANTPTHATSQDSYRTHVWQCSGPCKRQPPYFGLVKRSMNRPPGKYDPWWTTHQTECGGTYTKISAPAPTKKKLEALSKKERAGRQKNKLDAWLKPNDKAGVDNKAPEGSVRPKEVVPASPGTTNGKRKAAAIS